MARIVLADGHAAQRAAHRQAGHSGEANSEPRDALPGPPERLGGSPALDSGRHPDLALQLLTVFDSQVTGGKRYDLATIGRRSAHATFHTSHATDKVTGITWAIDLTPLVVDDTLSVEAYATGFVERFKADVAARIRRFA